MKPTITIATDFESGLHHLMAESFGMIGAAGPRLFRREPWPKIKFQHEDLNLAESDAQTLREYIDATWGEKINKKKQRQQHD